MFRLPKDLRYSSQFSKSSAIYLVPLFITYRPTHFHGSQTKSFCILNISEKYWDSILTACKLIAVHRLYPIDHYYLSSTECSSSPPLRTMTTHLHYYPSQCQWQSQTGPYWITTCSTSPVTHYWTFCKTKANTDLTQISSCQLILQLPMGFPWNV